MIFSSLFAFANYQHKKTSFDVREYLKSFMVGCKQILYFPISFYYLLISYLLINLLKKERKNNKHTFRFCKTSYIKFSVGVECGGVA